MSRIKDLTGQRFGRLTVRHSAADSFTSTGRRLVAWTAVCDCGAVKTVRAQALSCGDTKSCGCLDRDVLIARNTKHGMTVRGAPRPPEYSAWCHMIGRCEDQNDKHFADYGGRGVTVCAEWRHDFLAFLRDIGPRPSGRHSVDRIDNDGNYQPGNVKWSTPVEQGRNKRNNRLIEIDGEVATLPYWSERSGVMADTIWRRIERGVSARSAVFDPPKGKA